MSDPQTHENTSPIPIPIARLCIGLLQGLVLAWLEHRGRTAAWPINQPELFVPLILIFCFVPVLMIASLGHLQPKTMVRWFVTATLGLAALGFYDIWRNIGMAEAWAYKSELHRTPVPSFFLIVFSSASLFISQCLLLGNSKNKPQETPYSAYFEATSTLFVQLAFSLMFVGALWLALFMGAGLFELVKLDFLMKFLQEQSTAICISCSAFAGAMHLSDVHPGIVRGIRTLALVLLSWILPVIVLMIGGFLTCLPLTGLEPLWATKHATVLLLLSAAALVVLVNAAFQNGEVEHDVNVVLRTCARIACGLLVPITGIAAHALSLRIQQYGWSTDRVIATACLIIASTYALGYAWAAFQRKTWLKPIAQINVIAAWLMLALFVALFSPIADPTRIAVADQINRLETGKIDATAFDYDYLRFEGGRYGYAALQDLRHTNRGRNIAVIRTTAEHTLHKKHRWDDSTTEDGKTEEEEKVDLKNSLNVWPKTATLPDAFLQHDWRQTEATNIPNCLTEIGNFCNAYLIDLTRDGKPEILVVGYLPRGGATVFTEGADKQWQILGRLDYEVASCDAFRQQLEAGNYKTAPNPVDDLIIGKSRFKVHDTYTVSSSGDLCETINASPTTP